ncbi:hypothetical protein ACFFX0_11525 [Citricoccus parietis]|uniref:Uncharacterized protein n=1 Tax=Citricoccus parietis TaxID=592307 RepID=A0ABV5FYN4_9MICC
MSSTPSGTSWASWIWVAGVAKWPVRSLSALPTMTPVASSASQNAR